MSTNGDQPPMLKRCILLAMLGMGLVGVVRLAAVPGQAQSAATKAYYVAEFELTDPEGIKPYSAGVAATLKPFGGRFIVRGGKLVGLEGPPPGSRTVIIEFPSIERAEAWYNSPEYTALRSYRQRSGVSRTYIIEGLAD
jgi:uncharacterized protein (DUF1330 family)